MNIYDINGRELLICPVNNYGFNCNVCPFHKAIINSEGLSITECRYMVCYSGNMAKMPQLNHSQMGIEIDKSEAEEMAKEALDTIINQAPK